jgi:hypothetical protein
MRRALPLLLALAFGCGPDKIEVAKSQVGAAAERLDAQVAETGGYIRPGNGNEVDLSEDLDPWGLPLKATYTSGGMTESLKVRSAGPDGRFFNADDIVEQRTKMTMAGVGTGLKKNVEEFTEKGARGLSRGLIQGVKDQLAGKPKVDGATKQGGPP